MLEEVAGIPPDEAERLADHFLHEWAGAGWESEPRQEQRALALCLLSTFGAAVGVLEAISGSSPSSFSPWSKSRDGDAHQSAEVKPPP